MISVSEKNLWQSADSDFDKKQESCYRDNPVPIFYLVT